MVCSSQLAFLCDERHLPRTLAFGFARGKRAIKAGWLFRPVLIKSLKIPGPSQLETGPQILRRPDDGERELLPKSFWSLRVGGGAFSSGSTARRTWCGNALYGAAWPKKGQSV